MRVVLEPRVALTIDDRLAVNLDTVVIDLWNRKISELILPTAVKMSGRIDMEFQKRELEALNDFEFRCVLKVLTLLEQSKSLEGKELYYFGIGNALAFGNILRAAHQRNMIVIGRDISELGCELGKKELEKIPSEHGHLVQQADIEFACQPAFVSRKGRLLICSRVLEVLNKPFRDNKKRYRTCRNIGHLLNFLSVMIIYPENGANSEKTCGDAEPFSLEEAAEHMAKGLKGPVRTSVLGTWEHYTVQYTAALLEKSAH